MPTAILLGNMGGPDSLESVRSYLRQIFLDPDLIQVPIKGPLRQLFAEFLASRRAPKSRQIFQAIGGASPLLKLTQNQALKLENQLRTSGLDCRVFPAMRYWHPFIEDVWRQVHDQAFQTIVVVSLYPFYSRSTSGSLFRLVHHLQKTISFQRIETIDRFGSDSRFISAMARQIQKAVDERAVMAPRHHVLLSAHSLPLRQIRKGDPYEREISEAAKALKKMLPEEIQLHLSYQSKIGPVRWLGPSTEEKIKELKSVQELWVYPFGFVTDNSETLYEIGIRYKNLALEWGIEKYHRIDALNDHDLFVCALAELIEEKLKGINS